MSFSGDCHCGQVKFECLDDVPSVAMTCNCSICRRKGSVLYFTEPVNFRLDASSDALKAYEFNRHIITHYFCKNCGSNVFARVAQPGQAEKVAINLRCSEVQVEKLDLQMFDGASIL
jgi:hypothetical protein